MEIFKTRNFFIVIIVVCVSLVFSSCKEEKEQTEISSSSVVVQEEKSQKNKTENETDFGKGGIENVEWIGPLVRKDYLRTAQKGFVKLPSVRDIDLKNENGANRTASDVLKFFRQRTPGLRHVYRKHLKKMPGFQGQITLKFTIISCGEISDISIVSSTTQNREFVQDVVH